MFSAYEDPSHCWNTISLKSGTASAVKTLATWISLLITQVFPRKSLYHHTIMMYLQVKPMLGETVWCLLATFTVNSKSPSHYAQLKSFLGWPRPDFRKTVKASSPPFSLPANMVFLRWKHTF